MKAILGLLLLGLAGGGGWYLYMNHLRAPEARACDRLRSLCSDGGEDGETGQCESAMKKLGEAGGDKALQRAARCVADADSCSQGTGCMVGVGIGVMGDVFRSFGKGLGVGVGEDN